MINVVRERVREREREREVWREVILGFVFARDCNYRKTWQSKEKQAIEKPCEASNGGVIACGL